jgi:hypothetical protein
MKDAATLDASYTPRTGEGSDCIPCTPTPDIYHLPDTFAATPLVQSLIPDGIVPFLHRNAFKDIDILSLTKELLQYSDRERYRQDFEYWVYTAIKIREKTSGVDIPFRFNS